MPVKPSEKEEEYFARIEFERRRKIEEERRRTMQEQERQRLRELHFMRCPKCGMELIEIDYRNLKIDRCSSCQGIWLDANELEAIIAMNTARRNRFFSIFK